MTFEIEIDGRVRQVSVEPVRGALDGRLRVVIRDPQLPAGAGPAHVREVDVRETAAALSIIDVGSGRVLDASVTRSGAGACEIQLPHVSVAARVGRAGQTRAAATSAAHTGEQRLTAPLPGRIVKVLVSPGDEVAARQDLVVIEAMKMENALQAARAGRVHEVLVADGASVEAGRLLVVIRD